MVNIQTVDYVTLNTLFIAVKQKMEGNWLKNQITSRIPSSAALSVTDLCTTIFDTLSSARSDDQIQNEVR